MAATGFFDSCNRSVSSCKGKIIVPAAEDMVAFSYDLSCLISGQIFFRGTEEPMSSSW